MPKYTHRIKYLMNGEWERTGLMPESAANTLAKRLREKGYEQVTVYPDSEEGQPE